MPKPNIAGQTSGVRAFVTNNYIVANGAEVSPQAKYSVKFDHSFSEKVRVSGYIGWNRTAAAPGPNGPR